MVVRNIIYCPYNKKDLYYETFKIYYFFVFFSKILTSECFHSAEKLLKVHH